MAFSPAAVTLEPWPVLMELGSAQIVGTDPGPQSQCAAPYPGVTAVQWDLLSLRTVLSTATGPSSPASLSALFVLAFSDKRVTSVSYVCICHQTPCFQGPSTLELWLDSPRLLPLESSRLPSGQALTQASVAA